MPWPTMADYQEAIQNPAICFDDPELKMGQPVLNALRLPQPITGAFASVYKLQCGENTYAVRCFLRYHPDQEQRYAAISDYLRRLQLPCMVTFALLKRGIQLHGHWYPILKMEWIDGLPLNTYIAQHLNDPLRLEHLAEHFRNLMNTLNKAQIAHGDLQHGNILIANNEIRLIDYDGMYVPQLKGKRSHELGHRNYQHPSRSEDDFGPHIDHFSAWIIYISLRALSSRPDLWHTLDGGEEYLLFRKTDFLDIAASYAMDQLSQIEDDSFRDMLDQLHAALGAELHHIPALNSAIPHSHALLSSVRRSVNNWFGHRHTQTTTVTQESAAHNPGEHYQGPEWVLDYLTVAPTSESESDVSPTQKGERWVISGGILFSHILWSSLILNVLVMHVVITLSIANILAILCFLVVRYFLFPEVQEKYLFWLRLLEQRRKIVFLHWKLRSINAQQQRIIKHTDVKLERLDYTVEKQIKHALSKIPLTRVELPELPPIMLMRLRFFGVWTADDVNEDRVLSIPGTDKTMSNYLRSWHKKHEQAVRDQKTKLLEHEIESQRTSIVRHFRTRINKLHEQENLYQQLLMQIDDACDSLRDVLSDYQHVTFTTFIKWVYRDDD